MPLPLSQQITARLSGQVTALSGAALRPALPFIGPQVPVAKRLQRGAKVRVQELAPGYMIKERLLRPAMVAVAKKPE